MRKRNTSGEKPDFISIGKAMREAQLCEEWTQEEAAEKLGIEQPYYQLFQLSVDECFFPDAQPARSRRRRRLDALLDRLEEVSCLWWKVP